MCADEKLTAFYRIRIGDLQRDSREISLLRKSAAGSGSQALPRSRLPGPLAEPFRALATQLSPQDGQAEQSEAQERNCRAAIRHASPSDHEREVLVR